MTTELDNLHNDADGVNETNNNEETSEETTTNETTNTDETTTESEKPAEVEATESEKSEEVAEETEIVEEIAEAIKEEPVEAEETKEAEVEPVVGEEAVAEQVETEAEPAKEEDAVAENAKAESEEDQENYKVENTEEEEEAKVEVEAIPFKNYSELSADILIGEARELLQNHPARKLRDHFRQIRDAIMSIFDQEEKEKKEAFVEEGGNVIDFHHHNPLKSEFNSVYGDYRRQLDTFYKELEKTQQENLVERNQIIEELKALYTEPNEEISNVFKQFRDLKTRWHNAGPIPKAQAGNIFKTYFHHLDNFYEYLDLNKELRELDFTHNLEVRYSIIKRAEELVEEKNVQKALNELQYLHRLWKEEAVPVSEDHREPTWQRFKDLTNKIHDRKSEINERLKEEQEENLKKKQEIIQKINELSESANNKSHGEWQSGIRKLNALREEFLAVGRVPREFNQKMWNEFKAATRDFNHKKNEFYKTLKSEQQTNLEKKIELLNIAKEHAESDDWNSSVQIVKKIQADWKKIGHVPRKHSDKIWKEFKDACNLFFDNYKARGSRVSQAQLDNLEQKEAVLEELKAFKPGDNVQENLDKVNDFNVRWNSIGRVPAAKMSINSEYNKTINALVKSFGLSENEVQDFKMSSLVDQIKSDQDGRLLDDEIRKSRKQIEDLEKEITQLETNLGFFANADENSPLLKDVYKQIEEKRSQLTETEIRLRKLHQIDFDEEDDSADTTEG